MPHKYLFIDIRINLQAAGKSKKNIEKSENEKTTAEKGAKLAAGKSSIREQIMRVKFVLFTFKCYDYLVKQITLHVFIWSSASPSPFGYSLNLYEEGNYKAANDLFSVAK